MHLKLSRYKILNYYIITEIKLARRCSIGNISALAPFRIIRTRGLFPIRNLLGKNYIRHRTWKNLDENYKGWPHFTNRNVIKSKIINKMNDYYTFV